MDILKQDDGGAKREQIFVQIASYRDPECQWTVKDMFEKAAHPERIFAGIIWQFNKEEDTHCFQVPYPRPEQVRVIEVDAKDSKGVCWARNRLQQLWQGEEYTLQIDSHMRFEPGWDDLLIDMIKACDSPKAVLTTYPAGYTPPGEILHHVTYRLVAKKFDKDGIFTMTSRAVPQNPAAPRPVLGAFAGACMLFGPGRIVKDVPYDPHLYFFGEEITLSVRLWTQRYDIYHPQLPVIYHFWERKQRRTHFDDHQNWREQNHLSYARVRHLLGVATADDPRAVQDIDVYGLGAARTLQQYEEFSGVSFARQEITQAAYEGRFPANVQWQGRPPAQQATPQQQTSPEQKKPQNAPQQAPAPLQQAAAADNVVTIRQPVQPAGVAQAPATPAAAVAAVSATQSNKVQGHAPKKVLETPGCVVYDDFLPEEAYNKLYDFMTQAEYSHINTQNKVKKVWDLTNGFPLRTERNIFYYASEEGKPKADWVYPSKCPFDLFIEHINGFVGQVKYLVGDPVTGWQHFSVTGWLYPQGTGLSMHADGAGIYSGAYVYFMSPEWRPHWGGILMVMDHETNIAIQEYKKVTNALAFHKKKWLHVSEHDDFAMDRGISHGVFPKRNRIVFIDPNTLHMVTQVTSSAGDNVRMSLAGFFHRPKKEDKPKEQPKQEAAKPKDGHE